MARERRRTRPAPRLDQPRETSRPLLSRPQVDPETFGRISERFARFMGTATFLVYVAVFERARSAERDCTVART
jgi:uncharacterized membrane protein